MTRFIPADMVQTHEQKLRQRMSSLLTQLGDRALNSSLAVRDPSVPTILDDQFGMNLDLSLTRGVLRSLSVPPPLPPTEGLAADAFDSLKLRDVLFERDAACFRVVSWRTRNSHVMRGVMDWFEPLSLRLQRLGHRACSAATGGQ